MRTQFARLLKLLRKNTPGVDLQLVRRAYRVADAAHRGQVRLSGEPHISHSMAVARILAGLKLDLTTIAAGLLHDVLEDTPFTLEELKSGFGDEIAALVDGVTKIGTLYVVASDQTLAEEQAASMRKMLVATIKDVRVILIKLADRIHNMRTIEFLPPDKIQRISQETLDIYAPLAHRLGIARWNWELEDHAFHRLHPAEYHDIADRVAMKRREREAWLNEIIAFLEQRLTEADIDAQVIGRPKHLYSIYRKMQQQGKGFEEVMDMQAVRIVTQTEADCYNALGVVHRLWKPFPGRFKDYIPIPKANEYQSIHTTVMVAQRPDEQGRPLEIQIRTEEMDRTAQVGIAAHWLYKEGDEQRRDGSLEDRLNWLRQMYESLQEADTADEFLDGVKRDMKMSEIFVFTPKGQVKELPVGATPLDFAYMIHSDIGHQCIGARVNGRMAPLTYNLAMGDRVEILRSRNQTPHLDWIDMVVTARARTKIRQRLRELGQLAPAGQAKEKPEPRPHPPKRKRQINVVDEATREKLIRVQGEKGMAVQFARCCNPMPGQPVVGYVTRSPGITIHRADCRNLALTKRDPKRLVKVSWEGEGHYEVGVRTVITPRPNILADITEAIRPLVIDMTSARFERGEDGHSDFEFVFDTPDESTVHLVMRAIGQVAGVKDVTALFVREVAEA